MSVLDRVVRWSEVLATIAIAAVIVSVTAGVIAIVAVISNDDGGNDHVSADEVATRAAEVQTALLDSVKPDTTLHVVMTDQDDNANRRVEWWAYFAQGGNLESMRIERVDLDTQAVVSTTTLAGDTLVTIDTDGTEHRIVVGQFSIPMLRTALLEATNVDLSAVVAHGDRPAEVSDVTGQPAYVIEEIGTNATQRVHYDADSYRPVRVETIIGGAVVNVTTMPVFEFVGGDQVP